MCLNCACLCRRSNDSSLYGGQLTPGMANLSFSSYGTGPSPGREDLAGAFSQEMLAWYEDRDASHQGAAHPPPPPRGPQGAPQHPSTLV